jgi:integrase
MPEIKARELIRYSFKGPGWGRKSFTIYLDIKSREGKRVCTTIDDERLIAINRSFQSGVQTLEQCVVQVKEIIKDLYKKDSRCRKKINIHNAENWKVVDDFWEQVYSFRPLINEYTARNELKNAIEVLGQLSIYSASREEIQNCIDKKYKGNSQRRIVGRLSQLLKFVGRENVKLRRQHKDMIKVSFLNEEDFKRVLAVVPTQIEKTLLELCYYSGLRIGEAYGLEPHHLLPDGTIRVTGQLDRNGVRRQTKTKRPRLAFLFPQGIDAFKYWTQASEAEKATIDRLESSRELMKKYCKIAFPKDSSKYLTFHALRHCYAINLLSKGVSMSLVAQSLGNTLSVCQQHYVGFELTNDSIAAIKSIISR